MSPSVSVIIPVYNVEPYLRKCLDSVVKQTLLDIEVLCVDDGSTDGSSEILKEYAANDSRIRIFHQRNQGAGAARNLGMAHASGEYLFFFDADDFAKPAMLERMSMFARENNADIVISEFYRYDTSLRAVYGKHKLPHDLIERKVASSLDIVDRIFRVFKWSPWNKLFKRAFIQRHSVVWQNSFRCNDIAFVNESLALAERIGFMPEAYYFYREHSGSNLSSKRDFSPMSQYEAWCELKNRLIVRNLFKLFCEDFKRAAYIGSMNTINAITQYDVLTNFFLDFKKIIMPHLMLSKKVFTEESNTYFYFPLATDIEDYDSPLPFLLRFQKIRAANMRRNQARHKSVEKKLRREIVHQSKIIEKLREKEKRSLEYRFSRFKRKCINAIHHNSFKKESE